MISQELQIQNQESETAQKKKKKKKETAQKDHNLLLGEDQNLQNQEDAHLGSNEIEETGDDRVISVRDELQQARLENIMTQSIYICIYRVPQYLYVNDKESYFPQTISIGPYHYGKEHLQAMVCHKWRAVSMVLERTNQTFQKYLDAMKKIQWRARDFYEGPTLLRHKFAEMLVLDGCFVLELLLGAAYGFSKIGYAPNDPVFAIEGLMHSMRRDMLMLENQLPFFVLHRLAELQNSELDVRRLADHFFGPLMPTSKSFTNSPFHDGTTSNPCMPTFKSLPNNTPCPELFSTVPSITLGQEFEDELHCLNLFRHRLLLGISESPQDIYKRGKYPLVADKRQQRKIRCVTELRNAGFKFRKRETDSFWDIQFNEGFLEIPKLLINDGTESLFLNLIGYEQRRIYSSNYITSYVIFMDNLIDSAEDVHCLYCCGIIEHTLGNDSKVADMFNRLCNDVVFNTGDVYLSQLLKEVDRCYEQKYFRKWNGWMRTLKNKYFDSPWAVLSFFAALILLFLTCAQTYFAAYAYFKPAKPGS